ncbi:hypothetical protein PUN28_020198 [Cardiocondyla obscurior]|uniref:Uncharacterized protein n=1 Tax=Cardiocondyla obscurior TaxID=286306 RepID=A0AAW2EB90_9HYME
MFVSRFCMTIELRNWDRNEYNADRLIADELINPRGELDNWINSIKSVMTPKRIIKNDNSVMS